jgi:hypothetical protein
MRAQAARINAVTQRQCPYRNHYPLAIPCAALVIGLIRAIRRLAVELMRHPRDE